MKLITDAIWGMFLRPTMPLGYGPSVYQRIIDANALMQRQGVRIKEVRLSSATAWALGQEIGSVGYPKTVDGITVRIHESIA